MIPAFSKKHVWQSGAACAGGPTDLATLTVAIAAAAGRCSGDNTLRVDVWEKQKPTKILNSKKAVLLISWWGGYLHMCKPDTNAGGLGASQQNSSFLSHPLGTYAGPAAYRVS
jgi:hypothetical protein